MSLGNRFGSPPWVNYLDPRPLRIHDSEEDINEAIPFQPWHKSVYELARLLRWLELVDELPRDIPLFLETALSWSAQYDLMNEASGA